MFRSGLILCLAAAVTSPAFPASQEDINSLLGHSEELYYQAKFRESLELLTSLDGTLQEDRDHKPERIRIKLQLALSHLGLDEIEKAKANFVDMCELEPNCSIDENKYAPKVLALFEEALKGAADQAFQRGVDAYTANDLPAAVKSFRHALVLSPKHALSTQYLTLVLDKMRLAVEQKTLEWRKNFQAGDQTLSAANYRELESLNFDGIADPGLEQIRTAYRNSLSASLQAWERACRAGDTNGVERLRRQASTALPDPAIGQDLLSRMASCAAKPCVPMDVQSVMRRVKTSSEPDISLNLQRSLLTPAARTVQVSARIDESGAVVVLSVRGQSRAINDAVSSAVGKWTFSPTIIDNESRCVETVLPIVITPSGSD
jgi:tetratricopeptide (TPR) repeat protein